MIALHSVIPEEVPHEPPENLEDPEDCDEYLVVVGEVVLDGHEDGPAEAEDDVLHHGEGVEAAAGVQPAQANSQSAVSSAAL